MSSILEKLKLSQYGIKDVTEVVYNPSYEQLYKEEMDSSLEGFGQGSYNYQRLTTIGGTSCDL